MIGRWGGQRKEKGKKESENGKKRHKKEVMGARQGGGGRGRGEEET